MRSKGANDFLDSTDTMNKFALFQSDYQLYEHPQKWTQATIVQRYMINFYEMNSCCLSLHLQPTSHSQLQIPKIQATD